MMRLTAILFGLLLLSSSVQAKKVYSETDYRPPDYDVGHPELITEAKVVLTEKELEKTVYNTPRKVADISISQQAINIVLQQAEALLPKQPIYLPGDGQTYGTPEAERDVIWWKSIYETNSPIINLQIGVPELELRFDNLEIVRVVKQINRFEEDKRPITYINLESLFLKVSIRVRGEDLEHIQIVDDTLHWEIFTDDTKAGKQFGLYRYTVIIAGSDSITPDPEEVRKHREKYNNTRIEQHSPDTIGTNPKRIDVYFLYEPGFNTTAIRDQIDRGVSLFNKLLTDASGPSSFFIHSLGYGPAPALTCKPHNEPCNNLHSFDEVLEAMRESPAIMQLRREPYKQADLIIMFRTNIELGDLGDPNYFSEWTIYGKSYNPPSPANAKDFKWSVGAVSGNRGDATIEAIAHEIGHLMNAHHSKEHLDYADRDKSNPNNALNVAYHHISSSCPGLVMFGMHTFMSYKEVCNYKYRNARLDGCPPVNCLSVDRFSENGVFATSPIHSEIGVEIGTPENSNFTVMNYYAHHIVNYSVEAQKSLPPVAKISKVQGDNKRWEKQCWNGATSEMNNGGFHHAKWWVLVDGTIQVSDTFYSKEQSFCYRPLSNKQHTVKLRVTRLDNLSHTTELSFVPELPIIDKFNVNSDLSYVNLTYGFTSDVQPPTFVNYHIYEKDYAQTKPSFRNVETTNATSVSLFRFTSIGDRLDYKVKVCAAVGDCSPDSAVRTVIVDLWAALVGTRDVQTPPVYYPLLP